MGYDHGFFNMGTPGFYPNELPSYQSLKVSMANLSVKDGCLTAEELEGRIAFMEALVDSIQKEETKILHYRHKLVMLGIRSFFSKAILLTAVIIAGVSMKVPGAVLMLSTAIPVASYAYLLLRHIKEMNAEHRLYKKLEPSDIIPWLPTKALEI